MENEHGWTTLSSELKYQNPWIRVVEDRVKDNFGKEKIFGVVTIAGGVSVLPVDENGFVYLARIYRYGSGAMGIEVAGGSIDDGEDPFSAAKRELKEELGIEAQHWRDLGILNALTSIINHKEYLFLAQGFTAPEQAPYDEAEEIELVKLPFEEALRMVMDSKITHGPSAVLILKAANYLNRR